MVVSQYPISGKRPRLAGADVTYFHLIFSLLLGFSAAQTPATDVAVIQSKNMKEPLKVEGVSPAPRDAKVGSRFPVTVHLSLHEGFWAYEDKLKIHTLYPDGLQTGDIVLRPAVEFIDYVGKKYRGFQNKVEMEFFVEIPPVSGKLKDLDFELEYVACTQKFCLPKNKVFIRVPVTSSAPVSSDDPSFIEQKIEDNIVLAFLLIFAFGFLTSLTPCVYPLIPITLAVIGARASQSKKSQAFILSLIYVLGIAATYSLLGVIAAQTGALFGQALSYPPVIIAFSLLFLVMGLSMFGLFEIRVPHALTQKLTSSTSSKGYLGAFISGLIAGVIASPCVGPVLVGILAYIAKTQNSVLGFTMLFTFAMGMGVLFIALGTFSSLLNKLPRSGGWMNGIKYVLGLIMIGLSFYYAKPLLNRYWPSSSVSSKMELKNGWQHFSEDKLQEAIRDGKPVMIDFFADWCGACIELDEKAFSTPEFIAFSKGFMLLKIDATESFEGLNELQEKYDVFGLPTVVFLSKSGQMQKDMSLTGFEEAPKIIERMRQVQQRP